MIVDVACMWVCVGCIVVCVVLDLITYEVAIVPAAGCTFTGLLFQHSLFCTRVGAQVGIATSPRVRGAPSALLRPLGLGAHNRLCHVLNIRLRVWYRFWFHFGIKHIISIDLNKLKLPIAGVVQLGQTERALGYSDGGPGFEPCSGAFFSTI